ncbi:MAG TPA: flippase [Candidatus Binatia bacterium]|nr:flippase [Candidatus Binatia bacterium]
MKFNKRQILENVGSTWFALGLNVVVGIFLSPYILHRLGDDAFGLWILIFSVTGYYGLFDLGIRSSIVRYVARFSATDDRVELNRLVNTAMFGYSAIGILAMSITLVATYYVHSIFPRVPVEFVPTARWLLLIVGTSVSAGFPVGVFSGILEGLQRFHLLNLNSACTTLMRALLIVIALTHGHGLLSLALITTSLPLLGGLVNAAVVLRLVPLRFGFQYVSRASSRTIASYSGTTFVIILAGRLRFKTDALVIGTFVSAAAVTYFTIGARLVDYASEAVNSLSRLVIPMSSESQAKGDLEGLRKIFVLGNRACAFIILPIAAILTILGKSVIEAWVGPKYVAASYPVLLILLFPNTLMLAQSVSGRTLWGLAKHKTLAWVVMAEGIANLILSIILVRRYGIIGDAIGTAIPLICTQVLFIPAHLCRLLGIKVVAYLKRAFVLPVLLCSPMVAVLLLLRLWFVPHHLREFLIQVAIAGLVYGVGLAWAFWSHRAWQIGELGINKDDEVSLALVETYREEA